MSIRTANEIGKKKKKIREYTMKMQNIKWNDTKKKKVHYTYWNNSLSLFSILDYNRNKTKKKTEKKKKMKK